MQETVTEHKVHQQVSEFSEKGNFLDEEDMKTKYQHKPAQLESIWLNSRTMTCPIRKVKLWMDPEFSFTNLDTLTHSRQQKRKLSQEAIVKPAKKAKAQARPKLGDPLTAVANDPAAPPKLKKG